MHSVQNDLQAHHHGGEGCREPHAVRKAQNRCQEPQTDPSHIRVLRLWIGDLFRLMFPDSQIASMFTSGKDKNAYVTPFGLAPFIRSELICSVNKSFFVLMFDETLNHATKNKQLDVHGDQVHSRYLGSQFMGHATAQDLLHHCKIMPPKERKMSGLQCMSKSSSVLQPGVEKYTNIYESERLTRHRSITG
ncbi:hypothetical protein F2P81_003997 [Scophthalmus maximus]|uniref:Uncharacterized protein n=1 Tax=Scophthalmus maximus TaxID=52904 RepID=A0A6A4TJ06_SCOMX|nr:hypothetical protein F2P81_003997 [Scophthalmus maximus]